MSKAIVCGTVLLVSCQDSKPPKNFTQSQIAIAPEVRTVTSAVNDDGCLDYVKTLQTVSLAEDEPGKITISINTNKIYDEATLVKWLEDFNVDFFAKTPCAVSTVNFSVMLDAENVFNGVLHKTDTEMRAANKISAAEWVRRFEIARVETLASLIVVLKNSRATGDITGTLRIIDKIIDKDAGNQLWRLIKANTLLEKGSYFEAITVYETSLENAPNDLRALYNLSYAYKQVGNFSKSLELYQKIAGMIPSADKDLPFAIEDFYLTWADAHLHNNEPREALEKKKLAANESSVNGLLIEANALRLLRLFNDAKRVLEQALALKENEAVILFNLTLIHLDLKDVDGAKESFAKLKEADAGLAAELAFLPLFGGLSVATQTVTDLATDTFNPSESDGEEGESRF